MSTVTINQESKGFYKLSWLQRIGFGSGDLAQNLIFQTVACYLMIYLTTVLKLNPAFVSGLILAVRLIDCFWSPVVGRYIDNRNPKLGKYRAYLLYGGIPLTVAACLLMLPQAAEWGTTAKIIYATVSYTVLSMIYSVVNIPYGSIRGYRLEPGHLHGYWYHSRFRHPALTAHAEEMVGQERTLLHTPRHWLDWIYHLVHHR